MLSCHTVVLIGVDRYLRIKYYGDCGQRKVVLKFACAAIFVALPEAVLVLIMALLGKDHISTLIYLTVDVDVIGVITFLQIQTIRTANALHNESTVFVSEIINKKITKLSMQIMLLLCFLITPHLIVFTVSEAIRYQLKIYQKSIFEFFSFMSSYWHWLMRIYLPVLFCS